jgi:maltose alpha-D-glucosyltransferase / alpha-amylase
MNSILEKIAPVSVEPSATAAVAPKVGINRDDLLWYKDAIIYQLHVKAFQDANNDGIGDFPGLLQRLDYLSELGVTALWLLPFYPSPLRDDGYDISDYCAINPAYGSLNDFKDFIRRAHERGIRVITELVINHTSDTHPWFQRARRSPPGSPERDFYVWSDTDDRYRGTRIIFVDSETSNWAWDPVAKAYYWHRFYSHQPDLNFDNPQVFTEVLEALRFWLDLGVDGLRLDAVPYLCEREGTNNENLPETHATLKRIRSEIDAHYPDRMLLAEANQWPEDTRPYFGDGDECQMAFHFPLMPRMFMALAQEDRHPITDIVRQTPEIPEACQWALFLRNHDELTLEMVTDEERDYLWRTYAVDPRARINLGIRRRLASLMDNDRRKIELMNALLLSMRGTPVIYYGDEIGMGDNYYLGDRDGVRTPMQWSIDRNGGFSRADPQRLYLPLLMDPLYGYQAVNVESDQKDPSSLLNWMRRLIAVRKGHKALGRGNLTFLYPRNRKVLAYLREYENERILCVVNLASSAQAVELDLSVSKGMIPIELRGHSTFPPIGELPYLLTLPAYGFYWFLLAEQAELPRWHVPVPEPVPELITVVMSDGWPSVWQGRNQLQLENRALRDFLPRQRWFAAKNEDLVRVQVRPLATLDGSMAEHAMILVDVTLGSGAEQSYFLPVSCLWGEHHMRPGAPKLSYVIARLRRGPRVAALLDSARDEAFARAFIERLRHGGSLSCAAGAVHFETTEALASVTLNDTVRFIGAEQSNVAIIIGDEIVLKFYRRLQPGVQAEIEIARFLTQVARFNNTPAYRGSAELRCADGSTIALGAAFAYVSNQGDGWSVMTDALGRLLEATALSHATAAKEASAQDATATQFVFPLDLAPLLGRRTAEMHAALASSDDPDFAPEPITREDMAAWIADARAQAEQAFAILERAESSAQSAATKAQINALLSRRSSAFTAIDSIANSAHYANKCRHHGDYHLGQVLIAKDDVMIIDFEGEPQRSLNERRAKSTPLRDVAGMLRSFDYAAWAALDKLQAQGLAPADNTRSLAMLWRDTASRDFLRAYIATASSTRVYPQDERMALALLDLFLLQKAFYEIRYEAANRPAWLSIPLRGILELLARQETSA